jgi:hypothetical protein
LSQETTQPVEKLVVEFRSKKDELDGTEFFFQRDRRAKDLKRVTTGYYLFLAKNE